jgi:tetratricopeptide (TPR) repeat protein
MRALIFLSLLQALTEPDLVREAQNLASRGDITKATKVLEDAALRCTNDPGNISCEQRVQFGRAYTAQQAARHDPQRREAHLRNAAELYERVIGLNPLHLPTLTNIALVYRDLGDLQRAQSHLERALALTDQKGSYLLLLGELAEMAGDNSGARSWYVQAGQDADVRERATVRWLGLTRSELDKAPRGSSAYEERLREVVEVSERLRKDDLNIAIEGLTLACHRATPETPVWNDALALWADAQAERRTISTGAVAALPTALNMAMTELLSVTRSPVSVQLSWWTSTSLRRHAIANVMRALALPATEEDAIAWYEWALRVAPEIAEYDAPALRGRRQVRREIVVELAYLYHGKPNAQDRFARLEQEFLGAKTAVYESGDPELVHRFHTMLGLIYADRKQWQSHGQDNAIYHLDRAIQTAPDAVGIVPLPHLHIRLAEAYLHANQEAAARRSLIQAAVSYLDTDRVDHARAAIGRAKELPAAVADDLALVEDAIVARDAASRGEDHPWAQRALGESATPFVQRQVFRINADLAILRAKQGDMTAARRFLERAVSVSKQELTSAQDLVRLEAVQRLTANSVSSQKVNDWPVALSTSTPRTKGSRDALEARATTEVNGRASNDRLRPGLRIKTSAYASVQDLQARLELGTVKSGELFIRIDGEPSGVLANIAREVRDRPWHVTVHASQDQATAVINELRRLGVSSAQLRPEGPVDASLLLVVGPHPRR